MFKIIYADDYEQMSSEAYKIMAETLKKEDAVIGLATGSTPVGLYKKMIAGNKNGDVSFKNVVSFNLDEYVGIPRSHEQSYYTFMHENLFDHIDIKEENVHVPLGESDDHQKACEDYEKAMSDYVVDLQVLGIGSDGHIGFNEPGTAFDSLTHVVELEEITRQDNARFFDGDITQVPTHAITMGLGTIMRSKKIIMVANGENKADAIYAMIKKDKSEDCPASVLQDHPDVTVILDPGAAAKVK